MFSEENNYYAGSPAAVTVVTSGSGTLQRNTLNTGSPWGTSPLNALNGPLTTGALTVPSATIGASGTSLSSYKRFAVVISPGAVSANTCAVQTFTVTGVTTSDLLVAVGITNGSYNAGLSVTPGGNGTANTGYVNFCNNTASPITPTAGLTYEFVYVQ
jgi:hypothetical protein